MSEENSNTLCTSCRNPSAYLGQIPIRTKGSSGVAKLFFGEWAELGEEKWPLDVFRCQNCGHIDFFDLDLSI